MRRRLLEGGDAVRDRLDAGEGGASRRERAQEKEPRQRVTAGRVPARRRFGRVQARIDREADEAADEQRGEREDEHVRRDREDRAGLADAAKVEERDDRHEGDGDLDPRRMQFGHGRRDRKDAGGDGERDRHDVVDGERGCGAEPGDIAEVLARYDVRAAAARVGLDRLAVGERHDRQQQPDRQRDLDRVRERGAGARRHEHEEDLVGGVRARGEGVGGEDGERLPFREPLLLRLLGGDRGAESEATQRAPVALGACARRGRALRRPEGALVLAALEQALAGAHAARETGAGLRAAQDLGRLDVGHGALPRDEDRRGFLAKVRLRVFSHGAPRAGGARIRRPGRCRWMRASCLTSDNVRDRIAGARPR